MQTETVGEFRISAQKLVVENNAEKRTVDFKLTVVANEAQLPEPVHEKADPRPGCTNHLCQSLLTDFGNCNFGFSVLPEVSQQEENTSQPFLAGIEKLVNCKRLTGLDQRSMIALASGLILELRGGQFWKVSRQSTNKRFGISEQSGGIRSAVRPKPQRSGRGCRKRGQRTRPTSVKDLV